MWTPLDFYLCYIDSMEQQGNSEGRRVDIDRAAPLFSALWAGRLALCGLACLLSSMARLIG